MSYSPYRSATILIPFNEKPHLFTIMNDPCGGGMCLAIMLSSIKERRPYDGACIIDKGEHSFVKHRSYIVYRIAEIPFARHIEKMVSKKFYIPREDMDEKIFCRIAGGIWRSKETRPRVRRYADAHVIVDQLRTG